MYAKYRPTFILILHAKKMNNYYNTLLIVILRENIALVNQIVN